MGGISVEIHEPANVLSTMLLTITGPPPDARLHPIAEYALEHTRPFRGHPSLTWLKEFYRQEDVHELYGHLAQLAGPLSFTPRSSQLPAHLASYEPARMKELPARMAAFYDGAKLGTFRRARNGEYTLAAADVKDALDGARIEDFLAELYGPVKYKLVVAPVPTHPVAGGAVDARSAWESFAFLFPPKVPPSSDDPVAWSYDPDATQVLVQHELSHAILADLLRNRPGLASDLRGVLAKIPPDSYFAQTFKDGETRVAELFIRGSSVAYLRRTRGDEQAYQWMEEQGRRLGTPLVRDFFMVIERFLSVRKWPDLGAFLADLPKALDA
ncbi:MAG TPA: hypothetical protein VEM95_07305 [Thermoplasmata archaeon]|nr:hypothetical protein [Thermoplasmata archaeon]